MKIDLKMMKYEILLLSSLISINSLIGQSIGDQKYPPPPLPIHLESEEDQVYRLVEQMPRFPGCENLKGTDKDKGNCADQKMKRFLQSHLKYPEEAKKKNITGIVKASFVVDKAGNVIDERINEGLTEECDREVLRVLRLMKSMKLKFITRSSRHRAVKVLKEVELKFTKGMMGRVEGRN